MKNTLFFTYQDVLKEFPEKKPSYVSRLLTSMMGEGMIGRIARETYYIIPLSADPETYNPTWAQVAKYIMKNNEYYIGYVSALKILGFTLKPIETVHVVTKNRMKPARRIYIGTGYQFIHHDKARFFGFSSLWINQFERAMVSDLEKAIVDMAARPGICGGILELGNVMVNAQTRINSDKLLYYLVRNRIKAAKKRYLYLTHLLGLVWTNQHTKMAQELGSSISLLDPTAPDQGRRRMDFGLKINVDPSYIKNTILHKKRL